MDIIKLEQKRLAWSLKTFPEATALSSLEKLMDEVRETADELQHLTTKEKLLEEYADCLMCLFDSLGRAGFTVEQLTEAFDKKLIKNKSRTWIKNPNNTYSHISAD